MQNKNPDTSPTNRSAQNEKPAIDPAAWTSQEIAVRDDWIYEFTKNEITDLEAMIANVRPILNENPNNLMKMARREFDLGVLAEKVSDIGRDLKEGCGFALLRGLPVADWDRIETCIAYWAIGRHFGTAASNNGRGDMMGHVIDQGKNFNDPNFRAYQTKDNLDYHNDQTDAVALLCLSTSKSGGYSKIASVISVYNEMLARRPDLVEELCQSMWVSRNNEIGPDQKPWYEIPVFNFIADHLSICAGTKYIEKGHDLPGAPRLTEKQIEALALLDQLFEELSLPMEFRVGDIQILNNYVNVHKRTDYEDWPEPERKRHLWRLWLVIEDLRPLTLAHQTTRNGVWAQESDKQINLMPR